MGKFNLVEDPWIKVKMLNGTVKELGLRSIFSEAEKILTVEDASPLVVGAICRLLLAILYRSLGGPCSFNEAISLYRGGLSNRIRDVHSYLDVWKERFHLIDDSFPFFQIADYSPQSKRFWIALAAEMNDDNSKVLFNHANLVNLAPIEKAQAARWLLATQAFSVCKGKSEFQYTKGAPSASSIVFIIQGANLADSLLLMLLPYKNAEMQREDKPVWERPSLSTEALKSGLTRDIQGYADLYTWMSRSIRIFEEDTGDILRIGLASGLDYEELGQFEDPMLAFRTDIKYGRLPMQFGERGLWRSFDTLIPTGDSASAPGIIENAAALRRNCGSLFSFSLVALGQRNDKAKIEFWRKEKFIMPEIISIDRDVRGVVRASIKLAEDIGQALNAACRSYARKMLSQGDREADPKDVTAFVHNSIALSDYWSNAEIMFFQLLQEISPNADLDGLEEGWKTSITSAAWKSWNRYMESQTGARSIISRAHAEKTLHFKMADYGR